MLKPHILESKGFRSSHTRIGTLNEYRIMIRRSFGILRAFIGEIHKITSSNTISKVIDAPYDRVMILLMMLKLQNRVIYQWSYRFMVQVQASGHGTLPLCLRHLECPLFQSPCCWAQDSFA